MASATRPGSLGPGALAADQAGSLYVADEWNYAIRKIDLATATVTTLAGAAGSPGSTDGIGTFARFSQPSGIAIDGSGNLLVAECSNHTIRRIHIATATVTTFAGFAGQAGIVDGLGVDARFSCPAGLTIDGSGNLLVVDGQVIRRIVLATAEVTTLTNQPYDPWDVVSDNKGNLFVSDLRGHSILRIVVATQEVTTVVGLRDYDGVILGPLPGGLSTPTGLALGPSGQLLIADAMENAILAAWF